MIVMIPKNIKREHVIRAIEDVEKAGIPKGRISRKFVLEYNGKHYPPKYIVSLANKYPNGVELDSSEFSGGNETNNFLKALGFKIVRKPYLEKFTGEPPKERKEGIHQKAKHDERCPKCKETVRNLLEKIYGKVEPNSKFEIGTHPEDFRNVPYYEKLAEIYEALQNHRGFEEFVRAQILPHCDFFITNPGFIVEFDESQHFTQPRKITLEHYPELELGFDKKRWLMLCKKINAKDNDPPYRDEQRAWYDTLRDFLPAIKGLIQTVRLFARDFVWCNLNPDNPSDIKIFQSILKGRSKSWEIEVKEVPNPFSARIIIAGEWEGSPEEAKKLLESVYERFPKGKKVKFLVTCGGFIQFDWPRHIFLQDIGDNRNPNSKAVDALVEEAEKCARHVLSNGLDEKLKEVTDYITLGIDSYKEKISTTKNYISQPHVELIFLIDLKNNKFYWTGKSYPTPTQQSGLVRIPDLETHFVELDDIGKVMVLGCHDLSIFNPRSKNAKGWRRKINDEFKELAKKEKPVYVLQHPHTTVKVRTWLNAWNCLRKTIPSAKRYLGAGAYYEPDRLRSEYDPLDDVLKSTKLGDSVDFIVRRNAHHGA